MEEMNLFNVHVEQGTKFLFFNLGDEETKTAYRLLKEIRKSEIPAEIYHEPTKLDKQFKYAEKKNIPYVIIIGSRELENNSCVVKNIRTGEQSTFSINELVQKVTLL
jgi:histidyl-tRNA synthetase